MELGYHCNHFGHDSREVDVVGMVAKGSGIWFFKAKSIGIRFSSVLPPRRECQCRWGISMSISMSTLCEGASAGIDLCNPKE